MKHEQACNALGLPVSTEQDDVNPLRVAINYFFGRKTINRFPTGQKVPDYRELAIDACVKARTDFSAECNTVYDMATRYVKVKCPACGEQVEGHGGGGNSSTYHVDYRCKCGVTVALAFPADGGISVRFPEAK